jgi:hypothetical protein
MKARLTNGLGFGTVQPVGKTGAFLPFSLPAHVPDRRERREFPRAYLRHDFAIRALEKPGLLKPQLYVYVCLRCKYCFLVNERSGSIAAFDRNARPLTEPENSRRVATFAEGRCPAFHALIQGPRRTTAEMPRRSRLLRLVTGALARLFGVTGGSVHNQWIGTPVAIMPQDLLS